MKFQFCHLNRLSYTCTKSLSVSFSGAAFCTSYNTVEEGWQNQGYIISWRRFFEFHIQCLISTPTQLSVTFCPSRENSEHSSGVTFTFKLKYCIYCSIYCSWEHNNHMSNLWYTLAEEWGWTEFISTGNAFAIPIPTQKIKTYLWAPGEIT